MSTRHRTLTLAVRTLLVPLALLIGLFTAPSAQAATPYITDAANLRLCINTAKPGCGAVTTFAAGYASMVCWRDGSWATGRYQSNRWFFMVQGTRKGWIHSSFVTNQVSVPHCGTHRGVSSITWAVETRGENYAARNVADWMWGAGSDARWAGGCAGFVSAAYRFGVGVTPRYRGDAKPMYYAYKNAGLIRSMAEEPLMGAPLFWPGASSWGHTALYAGRINGTPYVMTTDGYPGQTKPNVLRPMSYYGQPAGWVAPNSF